MLHYINNFMTNRKFKVKTNGCVSDEMKQENGVPQGEVLSPTLFLLAINKITTSIPKHTKVSLFADDLAIYYKEKNLETIQNQLQTTICNLEQWTLSTGFSFSITKTKAIHFCKLRKPHNNPKLMLNKNEIGFANTVNFLGITFDKKLTRKPHLLKRRNECNKRINILKTQVHLKRGDHKKF